MTDTLVAYFSASGITRNVAENLRSAINADIYEIKPTVPYTNADLNWMDKKSRSTLEMADKYSRPSIIDDNFDISAYNTIFLGFPIWWYIAPTIVNTFIEAHDFSGKKVVLFATSGGSGFGDTLEYLQESAPKAKFVQGKLFKRNVTVEELKTWAENV